VRVAILADLDPDCPSFHVVLAEMDRDFERRDPRMVFASVVGRWTCERAVGMSGLDLTTCDAGHEVVARPDVTDDGGPCCGACKYDSSSRERAEGGCNSPRRNARVGRVAAQKGERIVLRDFDLSEPCRL
jgi:hypothetical protein